MKNIFFIFLLSLNLLLLLSRSSSNTINGNSSRTFKQWVMDTINLLETTKQGENQRFILAKDSLSLDIFSSYNLLIDSNYFTDNIDILYAIDLMERNKIKPKEEFKLLFNLRKNYSVSMVEQLVYDFNSEVEKFDIIIKDSTISYSFIKGNLINKKAH